MTFQTPPVSINGTPLDQRDAECLRAAVTSFHSEMSEDDALGNDAHGRAMAKAYRESMERILSLMLL